MQQVADAPTDDVSPIRLSKSRIAAFEHCPKRLWLQIHAPQLAKVDDRTLRLFEAGHQVGVLARLRHADGILVAEDHRELVAAIGRTQRLISGPKQVPIFEGAFQRDSVVVRADILQPDSWGGWNLIEVKSSGCVKPCHLLDVSTQAWVLAGNGVCISSVIIRHVDRRSRFRGRQSWTRFIDADVTADVFRLLPLRPRVFEQARAVARGAEPRIRPGTHCTHPFRCEFMEHCRGQSVSTAD